MFKPGERWRCIKPFQGYEPGEVVVIQVYFSNGKPILPTPGDSGDGWYWYESLTDYWIRVSPIRNLPDWF